MEVIVAADKEVKEIKVKEVKVLVCSYADSGGDMEVIVASDKEVKIGPVREAFQHVFGKATVT